MLKQYGACKVRTIDADDRSFAVLPGIACRVTWTSLPDVLEKLKIKGEVDRQVRSVKSSSPPVIRPLAILKAPAML